jgi:3-deoxy-D-manno-octulosonic-acid transferase
LRIVYVLLTWLILPFVVAAEAWQSLRHPEQRGRVRQRLGFVTPQLRPGCVWVHAVSVGEVQAAAALVRALLARDPATEIVMTTVTATGAQRAQALFQDRVRHCYLPYDVPGAVRRFLDRIEPRVAVVLETEIWPTLYFALGRRGIPLLLASARLSPKSVDRYRRLTSLFAATMSRGVLVGAQTPADAERFCAIGAAPERVQVTGNVKYDLQIPQASIDAGRALRAQCGAERPVWIAGSTHEGEEEAALAAHARLCERHHDALLVLVPRHPQRFDAVRTLLRKRNVRCALRSAGQVPGPGESVWLVDTLGELQAFYAAADIAFVAGSLVPIGGHNLLEPAVLGLPILSGPYTNNAQDIADMLVDCGALTIVADATALGERLIEACDAPGPARARGEQGRKRVAQSRGAVDRLVAMLEPLLSRPASRPAPGSPSAASGSR